MRLILVKAKQKASPRKSCQDTVGPTFRSFGLVNGLPLEHPACILDNNESDSDSDHFSDSSTPMQPQSQSTRLGCKKGGKSEYCKLDSTIFIPLTSQLIDFPDPPEPKWKFLHPPKSQNESQTTCEIDAGRPRIWAAVRAVIPFVVLRVGVLELTCGSEPRGASRCPRCPPCHHGSTWSGISRWFSRSFDSRKPTMGE